jgi:subtilase family serine protease
MRIAPDVSGLGPSDLQSAYKLPSSSRGAGQIVAIVDAFDDPNAESDLGVYRITFGLPPCTHTNGCFKKVNQLGKPGPLPPGDQSWGVEISLDIEMVSAICPKCHILLVEANSAAFSDLGPSVDTAVRLGADAESTSWGSPEFSGELSDDVYFNHPGVMITAASGGGYSVPPMYPASSSYVTAVGGTLLTRASNRRGWNEIASGLSGSGCSLYEAKPSWQQDSGCANRTVVDVAAVADCGSPVAVYDTYGIGGWVTVCGTSVSSPIIAGVYALAGNEAMLKFGSQSYKRNDRTGLFDIRHGTNGMCSPSYLCTAGEDYDGPTGNGTPDGLPAF